jgi:hypothetical protein
MGYHFLNPGIQGFDVARPHILVYERTARGWRLGAWNGCSPPAGDPAAARRSPETGAAFNPPGQALQPELAPPGRTRPTS